MNRISRKESPSEVILERTNFNTLKYLTFKGILTQAYKNLTSPSKGKDHKIKKTTNTNSPSSVFFHKNLTKKDVEKGYVKIDKLVKKKLEHLNKLKANFDTNIIIPEQALSHKAQLRFALEAEKKTLPLIQKQLLQKAGENQRLQNQIKAGPQKEELLTWALRIKKSFPTTTPTAARPPTTSRTKPSNLQPARPSSETGQQPPIPAKPTRTNQAAPPQNKLRTETPETPRPPTAARPQTVSLTKPVPGNPPATRHASLPSPQPRPPASAHTKPNPIIPPAPTNANPIQHPQPIPPSTQPLKPKQQATLPLNATPDPEQILAKQKLLQELQIKPPPQPKSSIPPEDPKVAFVPPILTPTPPSALPTMDSNLQAAIKGGLTGLKKTQSPLQPHLQPPIETDPSTAQNRITKVHKQAPPQANLPKNIQTQANQIDDATAKQNFLKQIQASTPLRHIDPNVERAKQPKSTGAADGLLDQLKKNKKLNQLRNQSNKEPKDDDDSNDDAWLD